MYGKRPNLASAGKEKKEERVKKYRKIQTGEKGKGKKRETGR